MRQGVLPPIETLTGAGRKILAKGGQTFNHIRAELVKQFPKSPTGHGYAVRTHVPLVQVPTREDDWGFPSDAAFALADTWLKKPVGDGLGRPLIFRYLARSALRAPPISQWWTGLRAVSETIAPLRFKLVTSPTRAAVSFLISRRRRAGCRLRIAVRFLPEYDSVVIAHVDRSRSSTTRFRRVLVTKNLIFPPTFLVEAIAAMEARAQEIRGNADACAV